MPHKEYNGYRNWTCWNVALWIGSDEGLYRLAKQCLKVNKLRGDAAEEFVEILAENGVTKTPDGAKYSKSAVRAAMKEM